jgi:phospholipase/carboxylesterase
MIALAVGLTRMPPPAAIVGYSGALANTEALVERQGAGPAILLVHGDMDEGIPVDAMLLAREQLAQAGLPVESHVAQGLGHGIDPTGLKLGGAFLKQAFAAAVTP